LAHRIGGISAATELARARRGKQFDPILADHLCADPRAALSGLDSIGAWDAVIDAEPVLRILLTEDEFNEALGAVADFVDLIRPTRSDKPALSPRSRGRRQRRSGCRRTNSGR
jgi:hypothetical protein